MYFVRRIKTCPSDRFSMILLMKVGVVLSLLCIAVWFVIHSFPLHFQKGGCDYLLYCRYKPSRLSCSQMCTAAKLPVNAANMNSHVVVAVDNDLMHMIVMVFWPNLSHCLVTEATTISCQHVKGIQVFMISNCCSYQYSILCNCRVELPRCHVIPYLYRITSKW